MILRCAHCRTRFAADDAHRGKTFRCRVCASPIKSDEAGAHAEAHSSSHSRAALAATVSAPTAAYSTPASAPPPATATARRHNERSKRDLFGGQVELASKVVERHESPFTAARNENSVLFSLDQLSKPPVRANDAVVFSSASSNAGNAGNAGNAANVGASAVGGAKKEDSGLIDLNRMMNVNDEKLTAKSVRPSPISEAPLGYVREVSYTPVPTTNESNPFGRKTNTKKTGLIAALAAAAVFAFAGVGVLANSHEDARVKAAAAAVAAPPPPPVTVTVAAPEPAPAPTTIAARAPDTTSDDKPETTKSSGRKARKGASKSSGASKSGSARAAAAPAAPKKAPDPCGCNGNLLCTMKCSAR